MLSVHEVDEDGNGDDDSDDSDSQGVNDLRFLRLFQKARAFPKWNIFFVVNSETF